LDILPGFRATPANEILKSCCQAKDGNRQCADLKRPRGRPHITWIHQHLKLWTWRKIDVSGEQSQWRKAMAERYAFFFFYCCYYYYCYYYTFWWNCVTKQILFIRDLLFIERFYRAMHVVLARYCYRMSSVRLSVVRLTVCLSVTLLYRGQIGWTSSKLITGIIERQRQQSSPRGSWGTPLKFG